LKDLGDNGYPTMVLWSCASLAWQGDTPEQIVDECSTNMAPGDIILLHISAAGTDSKALPALITRLHNQGFDFVTVDQILDRPKGREMECLIECG